MNIEDEEDIKNAVYEAEAELASIADAYNAAQEKVDAARKLLEDWYSLYG